MQEIISITTKNDDIRHIHILSDQQELYEFCESLEDGDITSIIWKEARSEGTEYLFFWFARKLISKLSFDGSFFLFFPDDIICFMI